MYLLVNTPSEQYISPATIRRKHTDYDAEESRSYELHTKNNTYTLYVADIKYVTIV